MPPNGLDTAGTYFARASHWSSCAALRLSIGEKPRLNTGLFVTEPSTTIAVAAVSVTEKRFVELIRSVSLRNGVKSGCSITSSRVRSESPSIEPAVNHKG